MFVQGVGLGTKQTGRVPAICVGMILDNARTVPISCEKFLK